MIIIILKLIILTIISLIASISDIKFGIIKNNYIIVGTVFSIVLNVLTCFFETSYIKIQLINILIINIISILLYVFHVWAGGDCKLIFVVSLLIPYEFYYNFLNPYFSLLLLLAFIFIFSYLYLIFDSVKNAILKKRTVGFHKLTLGLKNYILSYICNLVYIILINQLLIIFFEKIIYSFSYLLLIVNICLIIIISSIKQLSNKYLVVSILFIDIVLSFVFNISILSYTMLINYLVACLIIIFRLFVDEYNYETIPTKDVKPGMILSLNTTILFSNSRVKGLPELSSENLKSRLTYEEVKSILRWEKSKYGKSEVQIVRKIPFAIFISLGTIFFILLGVITE